jgi:hypothetical protein
MVILTLESAGKQQHTGGEQRRLWATLHWW